MLTGESDMQQIVKFAGITAVQVASLDAILKEDFVSAHVSKLRVRSVGDSYTYELSVHMGDTQTEVQYFYFHRSSRIHTRLTSRSVMIAIYDALQVFPEQAVDEYTEWVEIQNAPSNSY